MPMYDYACSDCGHASEEFQTIREDAYTTCPVCSNETYSRQVCVPRTMNREYDKPLEMHSLALNHDDDIRAFLGRNPGVQCSLDPADPNYGVPVARSRAEKLSILKAEGWEERN